MHLTFPREKLKAECLMTSQIRSRVEYLIATNNILVLLLHSNSISKFSFSYVFWVLFNYTSDVA